MSACPLIRLARLWCQKCEACLTRAGHAPHIGLQYVVQQRILKDVLLTCNFREGGDLRA